MTKRLAYLMVVLAVAVTDAQAPPQQPPPPPGVTFKVEINYVEVDATVTDAQGNFVRDLKKEDFQVLEDGTPQTVAIFMPIDLPIQRPLKPLYASTPIEPDVRTNASDVDGRVYVLLLDDVHTHALRTTRVKAAAKRFIEQHVGANDLVAVIHVSGRADAGQEFTSNRRLLLASVNKFMGRKLRSVTAEKIDEYNRQRSMGAPPPSAPGRNAVVDPLDFERGYYARMTLETVKNLANMVAGIRGRRKAVVFFSEGIDYDISNPFENRDATTILDQTREAISAATRGNVSVYAIDPRGLTDMGDEGIEIGAHPEDPALNLGPTALANELRYQQDSLRVLADETGGFAAVNSNDFGPAFDRLVRENSAYYVLGYYPANEKRDGRFRKIDVKVNRPGLRVKARRGYAAPRGGSKARPSESDAQSPTAIRELLDSPVPVSGLGLTVTAAAFKGAAPNTSVVVAVQARGRDLTFTEQPNGLFANTLDITVIALDQQGKIRGNDRPRLQMTLKPETHRAVSSTGLRTTSRLELPPGRYQVRVAARETGGGRMGSVFYDLEVPDFTKEALAMSGIVLTSRSAAAVPAVRVDEQLKDVLPSPPTSAREFQPNDALAVFAEVYDNAPNTPHKVDITTTVRSDEGRVIFKANDVRDVSELKGSRGGFGHRADIPLDEAAPGLYVLRVEARSRLGNEVTVARELPFRITAPAEPKR